VRPHGHPHPAVITELQNRNFNHHRTDLHYHVTVETDGASVISTYTR
jgi:beta-lactamase superfamily II metal-dependent hydrolase